MEVRRIRKNGRDSRARKGSGRNCMGTTEGKLEDKKENLEEGEGVIERKRLRGKGWMEHGMID